jgi:hypothetical protein
MDIDSCANLDVAWALLPLSRAPGSADFLYSRPRLQFAAPLASSRFVDILRVRNCVRAIFHPWARCSAAFRLSSQVICAFCFWFYYKYKLGEIRRSATFEIIFTRLFLLRLNRKLWPKFY